MTSVEIVSLVVTFIGVASFALVFTILYKTFVSSAIKEIKSGNRDIELIDEAIYEKQEKIKKRKKILSRIKSALSYIALILVVPLFVFSLINKFQGNTTMIGNKTIMVVASGSMSEKNEANDYLVTNNLNNQFQTYDIILLEKAKSESDIKLYDVVAYKNNEGINVIHRVIKINEDGTFITRGDANNSSDKYSPTYDDIIGVYTSKKINTIGIFVIFLQSAPGIITIISMIYVLVMVDYLSNKMNKVQDDRIEQLSHIIEQINGDNIENLKACFKETIYYKGFEYIFDENGFVDKKEIEDINFLNNSKNKIIKITEDKKLESVNQEEFKINSKEEE